MVNPEKYVPMTPEEIAQEKERLTKEVISGGAGDDFQEKLASRAEELERKDVLDNLIDHIKEGDLTASDLRELLEKALEMSHFNRDVEITKRLQEKK